MIYDRYEQYERRMYRLAKIVTWIRRYYKTVILPPVIAICAALAFLATIGTFTEIPVVPSLIYGETIEPNADAFISDISYEFREVDGTVWYDGVPDRAGTYVLRAVSRNGFGKKRYSDETTVVISPAEIKLECTLDACLYGTENESINDSIRAVGLIGEDRLSNEVYTVLGYSEDGVTVKLESFKIIGADGSDRTLCYQTEPFSDFVTLQPRKVELTTQTQEKVYDGITLSGGTYSIADGTLAVGDELVISEEVAITRVGTVENRPALTVVSKDGRDVTGFYDITFEYGTLAVKPRSVSISTAEAERLYDGTPLSADKIEISEGTLADGDEMKVSECLSITKVGTIDNKRTVTFINKDGQDVTDQYAITYKYGKLTMNPRPITVSTKTAQKNYDGMPLSGEKPEITSGALAKGEILKSTAPVEITYVGTAKNECKVNIVNEKGEDVTDQYNITYDFGTLTITQRPIKISTKSESREYNGTPLSGDKPEITEGSLAEGDEIKSSVPVEITYVGNAENVCTLTVVNGKGKDVTDQYDISYAFGTLTVSPRKLSLSTDSAEKIYDGKPLSSDKIKIVSGTLAENEVMKASKPVEITLVGTVENTKTVTITNRDLRDVTDQYEITWTFGALKVLPRPITIVTGSAEKLYDGIKLSCPEYSIKEGSLASGETLSSKIVPSWAYVGKYENKITFSIINSAGEERIENYDIKYEYGIIEIKPIVLYYSTEGAEKVYDAKPLTNPNYNFLSGSLLNGHSVSKVITTGVQTDAGRSPNTLSVVIVDRAGKDVTKLCYRIDVDAGMLVVKAKDFPVSSKSASKVYDGVALTAHSWTMNTKHFVEGHGSGGTTFTGSQTKVGSSLNYFTLKIKDKATGEDVTHNYNIIYNYGTLTVQGEDGGDHENEESSDDTDIRGPMEDRDDSVVAHVTLNTSKPITFYLRERSYGDYTMSGWKAGPVCNLELSHNPYFFSGVKASMVTGTSSNYLYVRLEEKCPAVVPYYVNYTQGESMGFGGTDVALTLNQRTYSVSSYKYLIMPELLKNVTAKNTWITEEESRYRDFVYKNYLSIPQSTKNSMLKIAAENGIKANSEDMIYKVQEYISHAATYNLDIEEFPAGVDKAVYFLTVTKEGYCQHFASAATLMYRALGVPARYTVGYAPKIQANVSPTDVTGLDAHAWVEIYLDRIGWVPMEVTASAEDKKESIDGQEVIVDAYGRVKITVSTYSTEKYYDGRPFGEYYGDTHWISEGVLLQGHRIVVDGMSQPGQYFVTTGSVNNSVKSLKILDKDDNDVTTKYNISYNLGKSSIIARPLHIKSQSALKEYDGVELYAKEWWIVSGSVAEGHTLEVDVTGSLNRAGSATNTFNVFIKDKDGNDVTRYYKLSRSYGILEMIKR